ncbi:MAG: RNA 2',3'-cyclic phosphodiesterase [Patescibacteria group bacterium]
MIRLFLAITPPLRVRKAIFQEISRLKKQIPNWQVNWIKTEKLHLTLLFLGWVNERQEKTIQKETAKALRSAKKFKVSLGNLSYQSHPIWLEVSQGKEELTDLQKKIIQELSFKEHEEFRPFHPHLTLGRVKKKGKDKPHNFKKEFVWEAEEVILYQSKPQRAGSVYQELAAFHLKG